MLGCLPWLLTPVLRGKKIPDLFATLKDCTAIMKICHHTIKKTKFLSPITGHK